MENLVKTNNKVLPVSHNKSQHDLLANNIYSKFVLKILNSFERGHLIVTLPDGKILENNKTSEIKANLTIHSFEFFKRCFFYGDIGLGESYMDGLWSSEDLTQVIRYFILNIENIEGASGGKKAGLSFNLLRFVNLAQNFLNKNSKLQAQKNIHYHYDLSNEFFKLMLDDSMTYSSGIFESETDSLYQSQMNKYKSLAQMLQIQETDHVLEIGSGWGGNAIYMALQYGCKVTSITISNEQYEYARKKVQDLGLENLIEIKYQDFRDLTGQFDKVVSIEMIEAIGEENMDLYFKTIGKVLKKDGLVAIQAITSPDSRYDEFKKGVDWIQKHIFPGSLLPSVSRMVQASNKHTNLHLVGMKDIGIDYAKTLNIWRENFFKNIDEVKKLGFDQTFINKWNYYLCYCEAAFDMKNISDVQVVFANPNNTKYKRFNR